MSTPKPGLFIVVEGMDGAGKSDVTSGMVDILQQLGLSVVPALEVGGTPIGKELRNLAFRKRPEEPLDATARMLMIYASRIQHLRQVVWPAITRGQHVVSDRFWMSTRVYQGAIDHQNALMDQLDVMPGLEMCAQPPDVLIYLNVLPEIAFERGNKRQGLDNDTYKRDLDNAKNVKAAYDDVVIKLSRDPHVHVFEINANGDPMSVAQQMVVIARKIKHLHDAPPKQRPRKPAGFVKV